MSVHQDILYQVVRFDKGSESIIKKGGYEECVKFLRERYEAVKKDQFGSMKLRLLGGHISEGFDYSIGKMHVQYYIKDDAWADV